MKIIKIYSAGEVAVKEIDGSLKSLQAEVGGNIEPFRLFEDRDIVALVNEERRILDLPHNQNISGIRGDVIIVGVNGEDFCDVPQEKIKSLLRIFGKEK